MPRFVAHHATSRKPKVAGGAFEAGAPLVHGAHMNLTRIREARGLTQRDLAEMIGMNASTIQRAEIMASTTKLLTYKKCAAALGVTLSDLFCDDVAPVERALIETFRRIPEEHRDQVRALFELVAAQPAATL
jgi:transcriptional regulator with XRE-family HTH domain